MDRINQHPEMFLLLRLEAERMGVQLSNDQLEAALHNDIFVMDSTGKPTPASNLQDPSNRLRVAIAHLLMIEAGLERASSAIKVSVPMVRHAIAENLQRLSLKMVEFPAADYTAKVPLANDAAARRTIQAIRQRRSPAD